MIEKIQNTVLDVRGETCPYPFFRTKWQMEKMESGEILKVMTDDSEAPYNIDAWTKKSGDEIKEIKKEGRTFIIYLKKI